MPDGKGSKAARQGDGMVTVGALPEPPPLGEQRGHRSTVRISVNKNHHHTLFTASDFKKTGNLGFSGKPL